MNLKLSVILKDMTKYDARYPHMGLGLRHEGYPIPGSYKAEHGLFACRVHGEPNPATHQ